MKRSLAILLLTVCALCATANRIDGIKFGAALGKAGYGPNAVRTIAGTFATINEMETNGNYRNAAIVAGVLLSQLDEIVEVHGTKLYGQLITHTGRLMYSAGLNNSALHYGLRAEEFWRLKFPKADEYVQSVVNLVCYYNALRDFPKSREWIAKGHSLTAKKKKYKDFAAELRNCEALLQYYEGNYPEAIRIETEILATSSNPTHVSNLITFLKADKQYAEAITRLHGRLAECEDGSIAKAAVLNDIATTIFDSGETDMAECIELSKQAENIYKKQKQTLDNTYAILLDNIAAYYDRSGDTTQSIAYARRAKNIIDALAGNAAFYVSTRNAKQMATLLFKTGDYAGAAKAAAEFCATDMKNTVYTMIASKKDVRGRVWSGSSSWYLDFMPLIALKTQDAAMKSLAYNSLLLGKGILLNAEKNIATYAEAGGAATMKLYGRWQEAQRMADEAYLPDDIDRTRQDAKMAEQQLMDSLLKVPQLRREFSHDWREVASCLKADEAAVEFAEVTMPDGTKSYVAAVVTPQNDAPAVVELTGAESLAALIDESPASPAIGQLVWQPLASILSGKQRIYFSPAGALHFVPLESLGGAGDGVQLVRLTSTRELLRHRQTDATHDNVALFGGIDYNSPAATAETGHNTKTYDKAVRALREGATVIDSLPGTRREVNDIAAILGTGNESVHTGDDGSEQLLRSMSGTRLNVLHIATHGFYYNAEEAEKCGWSFLYPEGSAQADSDEAPLYRSGLLMAGAGRTLNYSSDVPADNDGILTAAEIAGMHFPELDIVVLSACETGLGDVSGDGVFGLQRGFKKAGAGTLLMSLWKVGDEATSLLMSEFYRQLKQGLPAIEALDTAKEAVRSHPEWSEPECWSAFILVDAI